jgi:hypothetical protein
MKFGKETRLALAATCCLLTLQADAFVPASIRSTKLALVNSRMVTSTTSSKKLSRTTVVRRLAADDDDWDADDYEEGPLGKGIDSVSWLPSVVGKKGESIPSAKEVSDNKMLREGRMHAQGYRQSNWATLRLTLPFSQNDSLFSPVFRALKFFLFSHWVGSSTRQTVSTF